MSNRREFCLAIGAAFLLPGRTLTAQEEVFVAKSYQSPRGQMPYRLFTPPAYDRRKKYPLVVWLHGGAGRGNDNMKQISGGNTIGSHVWTEPENQSKHPCFVVAPQCPENESWSDFVKAKPSAPLHLVVDLVEDLKKTFSLDAQRLYVTGQSLGGFGSWSIIAHKPGLFAAAIPLCGGGDEAAAAKLTKTSIWAFHGEKDETVPVERTRSMIAAIRKAGGNPRYTEYPDAGHAIWARAFRETELLPWVFAQANK